MWIYKTIVCYVNLFVILKKFKNKSKVSRIDFDLPKLLKNTRRVIIDLKIDHPIPRQLSWDTPEIRNISFKKRLVLKLQCINNSIEV